MKSFGALLWPVLLGLLGVALLVAAIVGLQERLIYFPARATVQELTVGPLAAWPSADDFRGLVAETPGPARATVVVFHGNAGHAGHRAYYAEVLVPLGLRVILAEYPGYGPRDGAVGERSIVADAEQILRLARQRHGAPLLVIGESLGAGVAAAAASRQRDQVAGLMLITPWDRLAHVAALHYPWLPVGWLLRDRYDSAAHLASFGRPVWVAVAEYDKVVPARLGQALFERLSQPKHLQPMPGAGHNDWVTQADANWWRRAISFTLDGTPPR